mgnify:FL=1
MISDILTIAVPAVIVLVLVIVLATSCYTVAPTDRALVITGPGGRRFVIGKSALIVPFIMRRDWLSLGVIQVKLQTEQSIPTKDALLIDVGAVANVQIGVTPFTDAEGVEHNPLEIAARNYLNQDKTKMMTDVSEVLLGKMREAIGRTDIRTLMQNRDEFNETIVSAAHDDMLALGLELVTFNVQDFSDQQGVIADMGAEMASRITQEAQLARINSEQTVAERQNELDLKQADLQKQSDHAKAEADMVYDITKAERQKDLNIATQNAEIAAEERRIELERKKAETREQELTATVRKQADADRYAAEQKADAQLYTETKKAEAVKVTAGAEAESIKLKGSAEGEAIAAKGKGEAEGIEAQGKAYNAMNNTFILTQQYIGILPDIARAIADPLAKVDKITMYGEGNTTKMVGDTTNAMTQLNSAFQESLGIDLTALLQGAIAGHAAGTAIAKSDDAPDEQVTDEQ